VALRAVRHDEQQVDVEGMALRDDLRCDVRGQFVEHADGSDDGDGVIGVSADHPRPFELDHAVPRIGDVGVGECERAYRSPVGEEHLGEIAFAWQEPVGQIVVMAHPRLVGVVGATGHQQCDGRLVQWDGQRGQKRLAEDGDVELSDTQNRCPDATFPVEVGGVG
jgi:hypothetical protein